MSEYSESRFWKAMLIIYPAISYADMVSDFGVVGITLATAAIIYLALYIWRRVKVMERQS